MQATCDRFDSVRLHQYDTLSRKQAVAGHTHVDKTAPQVYIEVWCSGNTSVSKTETEGSIPSSSANSEVVMVYDTTCRLTIRGIGAMTDEQVQSVVKWLRSQADSIEKKPEEYTDKTYTATLRNPL